VISERWCRLLAEACLVRVNVNACLQFLEVFLAPEDKPFPEALATAAICRIEIKRLGVI
jgi:hypothetical protein